MSNSTMGLIVGGFIPAIFFALSGISAKFSTKAGVSLAPYLILIGLSIVCIGILIAVFTHEWTVSWKSAWPSIGAGLTWGTGSMLLAFALTKYHTPISQLTPLYNTNTLLVVIFGLIIFSEWKEVQVTELVAGSVLIVVGSGLVSAS